MNNVIDFSKHLDAKRESESSISDLLKQFAHLSRELPPSFSDEELSKVCLLATKHGGISSEDQIDKLIADMNLTVLRYQILCMALKGDVYYEWSEEENDVLVHAVNKDENNS